MANQGIKIDGVDDTVKKLRKLITPDILDIATARTYARMQAYPPTSSANRPAPGKSHYIRGVGTAYTRKSGGTTIRRTSAQMGRRWKKRRVPGGVSFINTAPYAQFVLGDEQKRYHARRGWPNVERVVIAAVPEIERNCLRIINQRSRSV